LKTRSTSSAKEEMAMNILRTATAGLVVGALLYGACLPTQAMAAGPQVAPNSSDPLPASSLSPLALPLQLNMVGAVQREAPADVINCRAGNLYSQHDVVGDPERCNRNTVNFGTGGGQATGIGR
jgi:hypothetical protein